MILGGKLSEGINFSDDLARCVVVVGLPYANSRSAELKEKMEYLNRTTANLRPEGENRTPGQMHYESLCFKAINQSIGRAIRHRNDYAALILADARYARPASQAALPAWIAKRLSVADKFGPALVSVRKVKSL
jgi:chromosome transmission fidelity protein 1